MNECLSHTTVVRALIPYLSPLSYSMLYQACPSLMRSKYRVRPEDVFLNRLSLVAPYWLIDLMKQRLLFLTGGTAVSVLLGIPVTDDQDFDFVGLVTSFDYNWQTIVPTGVTFREPLLEDGHDDDAYDGATLFSMQVFFVDGRKIQICSQLSMDGVRSHVTRFDFAFCRVLNHVSRNVVSLLTQRCTIDVGQYVYQYLAFYREQGTRVLERINKYRARGFDIKIVKQEPQVWPKSADVIGAFTIAETRQKYTGYVFPPGCVHLNCTSKHVCDCEAFVAFEAAFRQNYYAAREAAERVAWRLFWNAIIPD